MYSINLDNNNPYVIVSKFLKDYPRIDETNQENITFQLICSILSRHVEIKATEFDFKILQSITSRRFLLPINQENHSDFFKVVGDLLGKGNNIQAGVYKFTNKVNGFSYIGSSVQLANRLTHAYLGNRLGKRKIELALQDLKLESFYLDVYILPGKLIEGKNLSEIKELTLLLEQYHIPLFF